jgi:hypothetical protein
MQVILSRCLDYKIQFWSKLGRIRRSDKPSSATDRAIAETIAGCLLCDIYLTAEEHLSEGDELLVDQSVPFTTNYNLPRY